MLTISDMWATLNATTATACRKITVFAIAEGTTAIRAIPHRQPQSAKSVLAKATRHRDPILNFLSVRPRFIERTEVCVCPRHGYSFAS
jgi:hypothetical protein